MSEHTYCTTTALPDLSWCMCNDLTKEKLKTTVPQSTKPPPPTTTTTTKFKPWYELNALKH